MVGTTPCRRGGGLTGPKSDPLQADVVSPVEQVTTRLVWESICGHPLDDNDLAEIQGNLFRFIDLLASISSSILGAHQSSTSDGDQAA